MNDVLSVLNFNVLYSVVKINFKIMKDIKEYKWK